MCTSEFEKCNLKLVILLSGFSLESPGNLFCLFVFDIDFWAAPPETLSDDIWTWHQL